MKIPSTFLRGRGDLDVKMTPMIDVVFLLLVFFVWTASFQIIEYSLPSQLLAASGSQASPEQTPLPPPDFDSVVVEVVWLADLPGWIVNNNSVSTLDAVRQTLLAVAAIKRDVPLIIDPAPDVPLGDVIDVYDLSRLAGFEEVQFAASEKL